MRLLSVFGLFVLVAAVVALSGCRSRYEWRQKLTVTVETPHGEYSGSSVVEVVALFGQLPASGNEVEYKVSGEATIVELGGGRYLFALLGGSEERFYRALGYNYGDRGTKLKRISGMQGETRMLERENYPLLVTFENVSDPTTVRQVDPTDFVASFGPGYALKSITLEITDEPVTEGSVESVLGWWQSYRGGPYNSMKSLQLPNDSPRGWEHLSPLDFWSLDRVQEFNERSK